MSQGFVTVFIGPVGEANLLRSELEAKGIPAFIPDETMRTIDPFATGGLLAFDRAVQVPPSAAAQARTFMEARDEESDMREGEEELPADFFKDEPAPAPESESEAKLSAQVAALSRRIRWCSILPIGAPFVLWELAAYLTLVKRMGQKPPLHRTTIAAACISPVIFVATFGSAFF